jgi:hypothetical protein
VNISIAPSTGESQIVGKEMLFSPQAKAPSQMTQYNTEHSQLNPRKRQASHLRTKEKERERAQTNNSIAENIDMMLQNQSSAKKR